MAEAMGFFSWMLRSQTYWRYALHRLSKAYRRLFGATTSLNLRFPSSLRSNPIQIESPRLYEMRGLERRLGLRLHASM